jgi:hypothetical protein
MGKTEYPKNPLGNDKDGFWNELSLSDAMQRGSPHNAYKRLVLGHFEGLFFSKYKEKKKRNYPVTESFVRSVIHVSLDIGFRNTVICVNKFDRIFTGIEDKPARTALQTLHDLGLTIYFTGYGKIMDNTQVTFPKGFSVYPHHADLIDELAGKLLHGKINISDIKNIKL